MPPKKKKTSVYNRILKEFTKINGQLPEDRKLSIKERRDIIKEKILPKYEDVPAYKLRTKQIKSFILQEYEKIPPKEICDLNYIDPSEFAFVEWHSLDETIVELVPDCVYIKVSAGDYGETKIFNTRDYQYGKEGVRSIVENIRVDANEEPSGTFIFTGYQKLRPRKKNDGTPENYYLDFVLVYVDKDGNEETFSDTETTRFDLPKTREVKKKKTKIRNVIEGKIKDLKSKRDGRKRARKTLDKNIKLLEIIVKRTEKAKNPSVQLEILREKQFEKASKLIEKYYKEGKFTKLQYDNGLKRLIAKYIG